VSPLSVGEKKSDAIATWETVGDYVVPWESSSSGPNYCSSFSSLVSPGDDDEIDDALVASYDDSLDDDDGTADNDMWGR
jgi:hypothetical protein